jgi:hypothetical protein
MASLSASQLAYVNEKMRGPSPGPTGADDVSPSYALPLYTTGNNPRTVVCASLSARRKQRGSRD